MQITIYTKDKQIEVEIENGMLSYEVEEEE